MMIFSGKSLALYSEKMSLFQNPEVSLAMYLAILIFIRSLLGAGFSHILDKLNVNEPTQLAVPFVFAKNRRRLALLKAG